MERIVSLVVHIKKESPNEGTETRTAESCKLLRLRGIKKESPNEGTETNSDGFNEIGQDFIKKESPNEGTETFCSIR